MTNEEMAFARNVTSLEPQLVQRYPQFRKIWVQYCRPSKKSDDYSVLITLFSNHSYTMAYGNTVGITLENTSKIIDLYLEKVN